MAIKVLVGKIGEKTRTVELTLPAKIQDALEAAEKLGLYRQPSEDLTLNGLSTKNGTLITPGTDLERDGDFVEIVPKYAAGLFPGSEQLSFPNPQ